MTTWSIGSEEADLSFDLELELVLANTGATQAKYCTQHFDYYVTVPYAALLGEPKGGAEAGSAMNIEGDLDGDGVNDLLVADPGFGNHRGRVYFLGGQTVVSSYGSLGQFPSVTGADEGDRLGGHLGTADVNGDGYDDMLVGATQSGASGTGYGIVQFGGPSLQGFSEVPPVRVDGMEEGDGLGPVTGTANFDGDEDGYADFALGAPGVNEDAGAVYLLYGGPNLGGRYSIESRAWHRLDGDSPGDRFGQSVVLGPDPLGVEAQGILLVGAPGVSDNEGRVFLFNGGDW